MAFYKCQIVQVFTCLLLPAAKKRRQMNIVFAHECVYLYGKIYFNPLNALELYFQEVLTELTN